MKKELDLHTELKEIAPLLASLPKMDNELSVPDGYFDTLSDSIFERIDAEDKIQHVLPKGQVISFGYIRRAAAVVLTCGVSIWLWRGAQTQEVQLVDFSQIDSEEMMAYVTHNISDFEEDALFDGYSANAIDELFLNVANAPEEAKTNETVPAKSAVKNDTVIEILGAEPTDEEIEKLLEDIDEEDIF